MDTKAEKLEIIRLITELDSDRIHKKIKGILSSAGKADETERLMSNPAMMKRIENSRSEIAQGNGKSISLDDVWK
jgi:hypothetical protein